MDRVIAARCTTASVSWEFKRGGAGAGDLPSDGEPLSGADGEVGRGAAGEPLHPQADADGCGEKVLQKTRTLSQISQEIEDQSVKDLPSGTLRVACAHFTAMHIIVPVLPDLLQRYPQLRIELDVNNHPVSLVGERIDVAIRITDNPEPGMIARRLGECRSVLCASPHYLASRGVPEQLEDLSRHNCLHYSFCRSVVAFLRQKGSRSRRRSAAISAPVSRYC